MLAMASGQWRRSGVGRPSELGASNYSLITGEAVVEEVGGGVEHQEDLLDVHCDVNPVRWHEAPLVLFEAAGLIPLIL